MNNSSSTENQTTFDDRLAVVRVAFLYANIAPGIVETVLCTVVLVTATTKRTIREIPPNLLVLVSAACDLIRGIHTCLSPILYKESGVEPTQLNEIACKIYQWAHMFQYAASFWLVAAIAYSRYDVVARPMNPRLTRRGVWGIVLGVVAIASTFASLPLVGWNRYALRRLSNGNYRCAGANRNGDAFDRAFVPVYFGINSLIPIIIVVAFLVKILPIAVRSDAWKESRRRRRENDSNVTVSHFVKSKSFRYVLAIVVTNVVLSTPYVAVKILRDCFEIKVNYYATAVCKLLLSVNYVLNSVLYVFWARTFQEKLSNVFCLRRWRRKATTKTTSSSSSSTGRNIV